MVFSKEKTEAADVSDTAISQSQSIQITAGEDQLQRRLGNRQVQLIAIGGSIGTASFVSIATGLIKGGPGSLFIAYSIYATVICLVSNCMAEMAVFMPISSSFIRFAGHWVDDAFGFMAGWNFFIYEAVLIPFELTALNMVLTFWRDDIPVAAVVAVSIVLYVLLNAFAVKWYGEAEFWLTSGKVILFFIVFFFTFITMVGGNPQHDAYGFRYWKNPGAFAEYITTGTLGRFEGFLGALWGASFTIVGPEYVTMLAGETKHPRKYLKLAFTTTYARIAVFFVVMALCAGIVVPYNDPVLVAILNGTAKGAGTAASSPYVIAMNNMGVEVVPHIANALLVSSIFSAGNAYTYCGTRSLYGLALEGQAPKFMRKVTKNGVPIYCLAFTTLFPCLAFLNVSSSTAKVLTWFTNVITAAQIIDYIVMCATYLCFYRACKVQGYDRSTFPYYARFQPYSAWIGLVFCTMVVCVYGYAVFLPGHWDIQDFFTHYTMVLAAPVFFFGWKLAKRTKFIRPEDVDLVWERPMVDAYEANETEPVIGFFDDILAMVGIHRKSKKAEA